jgi:hypothetical protein
VDTVFFRLGRARCSFHKECSRTHYAELVFLNPVRSAGLVVHSSASGAQNKDALFFLLRWAQCGFHKKRVETQYVELMFLHPVGSAGHVMHYHASGA